MCWRGLALLGHLDIWELLLLAALLAPTDAALAAPVVADTRVPARVRDGLDVEAGLNDGVCVPVVMFALAAAVAVEGTPEHGLAHEALVIIGGGVVVGVVAGAAGGRLVALAIGRGTVAAAYEQMALTALAVTTFFAADAIGASGFIAAFVGGLLAAAPLGEQRERLTEFMQEDGELLSFAVFYVFGILAASVLDEVTWAVAGYAVLSLTVARMVPVALALLGSRAAPPDGRLHGLVRAARDSQHRPALRRDQRGARPARHGDDRDHGRRDGVAQHRAPRRECRAAGRSLRRLGPGPARPCLRARLTAKGGPGPTRGVVRAPSPPGRADRSVPRGSPNRGGTDGIARRG